ncbi:hypothetical protein B4Q13_22555, partial [Lacticaseibacillus rhamnosus]
MHQAHDRVIDRAGEELLLDQRRLCLGRDRQFGRGRRGFACLRVFRHVDPDQAIAFDQRIFADDDLERIDAFVANIERELIQRSLERTGGNKGQAARLLNLKRQRCAGHPCLTSRNRPVSTSTMKPRTGTSLAIHGCARTFSICARVFSSGSLKENKRIGTGVASPVSRASLSFSSLSVKVVNPQPV